MKSVLKKERRVYIYIYIYTSACERVGGGVASRDKDEVWQVVERQRRWYGGDRVAELGGGGGDDGRRGVDDG